VSKTGGVGRPGRADRTESNLGREDLIKSSSSGKIVSKRKSATMQQRTQQLSPSARATWDAGGLAGRKKAQAPGLPAEAAG
jgi:hypothetical protein